MLHHKSICGVLNYFAKEENTRWVRTGNTVTSVHLIKTSKYFNFKQIFSFDKTEGFQAQGINHR